MQNPLLYDDGNESSTGKKFCVGIECLCEKQRSVSGHLPSSYIKKKKNHLSRQENTEEEWLTHKRNKITNKIFKKKRKHTESFFVVDINSKPRHNPQPVLLFLPVTCLHYISLQSASASGHCSSVSNTNTTSNYS